MIASPTMTIGAALDYASEDLRSTSESPRADAYRLLQHALQCSAASLIANDTDALSETALDAFHRQVEERRAGVPIAYIVGNSGFFGATYAVNADVLIPRPETELLVEAAVKFLARRAEDGGELKSLDVGTGSGAIACAIARALPQASLHGTDISAAAIALAKRNADRLNVASSCKFFLCDLTSAMRGERYACVIANLPYIASAQLPKAPQPAGYEPRCALDGGSDGLDLYRRLLPQLPQLVADNALVLLEAAPPVMHALTELCGTYFPNADIRIHRDYAQLERFVAISTGGAIAPAE